MKRAKIVEMLKEVMRVADYNVYKNMFVPDCVEDEKDNEEKIDDLVEIVKNYVD